MSKLWGGRFAKQTDSLVHQFNASIGFDVRMAEQDITGSVAWAHGLVGAGILSSEEMETIVGGLEQVRQELAADSFVFTFDDEDIHTAVERRLIEIVGPVGGKLHTGRSRNDQAATDFRLWVMAACEEIRGYLADLQQAMVDHAVAHLHVPMPGYTHLQHAQPVTWGHWLLSHFWPLVRDSRRFKQTWQQASVSPLGAAALAGTAFAVDRQALADILGFTAVSPNSLDAVSDRDHIADFLYAATMTGLHLSRLSEQLILFSTNEFGFVVIDDGYSTGSSIMPQKKNPDTLELTRGKSGRLLGNLTGLLTTIKGLPSSYDKDLQEDKEPVLDTFDTLSLVLPVMAGVVRTLQIRPERMAVQLEPNLMATDLADYLAKRGMPFREAHGVVGQVVQLAETKGVVLTDLTLADLQGVSEWFGEEATAVFDVQTVLANRTAIGGVAPSALEAQLEAAKEAIG